MTELVCDGCGLPIPAAAMPIHHHGDTYCSSHCLEHSK